MKVWPGGSSGGSPGPGRKKNDGGATRGKINGWSRAAQRRLVAWLWSVDATELAHVGDGWALTLTVGETPADSAQWHAARKAFQMRMTRGGATAQQWLVEWTRKGRPHLHMAVYGPGAELGRESLLHWLAVCDKNGWPVSARAQHIVPISGLTGWLKYISKHSSRGVDHYQRQGKPEGWETTGRLWGVAGDWPVLAPIEVELEAHQFHEYRRHVRRYQRAQLRAVGAHRAARMVGHRHGAKDGGAYMGVSGWIPEHVSLTLVELAAQKEVRLRFPDER